jgi:serine palmitoyltransferase
MIDLEAKLRLARTRGQPGSGRPWRKIIVLVEGIYSMEGEFCLLRQVVALKRAYGAYLYLDEAHSIGAVGATGRGVAELLGVPTSEIDVMMGTFTKSFGSVGGYVAGSHAVIAALRAHSHSVLHANAMSVPAVQQVLSSLRVISQADGPGSAAAAVGRAKLQQLAENTAFFRQGLLEMGCEVLGDDGSPVVPIMIYHPRRMCLFSRELLKRRVAVVVVGYPASPILLERARFCVSAAHTRADLEGALRSIREVAAQQGLFYHADPALRKATAARCAEKAARLHGAPLVLPNEAEIQAALGPWTPEPLCGGAPANLAAAAAPAPARAAAVAASTTSLALALYDPLGFCAEATLRATAAATIRAYGVGTCGPRAFYGTLDLHMQLEDDLARFLGTERSIVYSSAVATISSVLPAFAKRVDTVFVDDGALASARLRQGVELSRARVRVYPLGEMGALKALLDEADAHDARLPVAKRGRRIIVTEGVCAASGDVAPLPALLELRDAYGAYLFVDETHSIGVLGAGGRGVAEHYGIAPGRIDAIIGSLEGALGSVGGFCAGSLQVVRQQRLFATGFIFSASLPAYCTAVAQRALALLIAEPERAAAARAASRALRVGLDASGVARSRSLVVSGGECGLLHVRAPAVSGGPAAQRAALERVAARVLARAALGLVVLPTEEAAAEPTAQARARAAPLPSLRLTPCGRLTAAQLGAAVEAIAAALAAELPAASPGSPLALKPPMLRANGGSAGNAAGLDLMLPPAALGSLRPARSDDGDSTGSSSDDQPGGAADDEPLAPTRVAAGGAAACGGKAAGGKAGADDSELVTAETPLGLLLALGRRQLHVYLRRQAEWGVRTIVQPAQAACASSRVACHVFYVMSLFGSEAFYMASFPLLIWTEAASGVDGAASLARTLVLFFAASVVVGNVLKVWLALPRPQLNAAAGGARIPPADEGWNRDFAWPSISAMNAVRGCAARAVATHVRVSLRARVGAVSLTVAPSSLPPSLPPLSSSPARLISRRSACPSSCCATASAARTCGSSPSRSPPSSSTRPPSSGPPASAARASSRAPPRPQTCRAAC